MGLLRGPLKIVTEHPKDTLIIVLSSVLLLLNWQLRTLRTGRSEIARANIGLPPESKQVITVHRDRVITKWRESPAKIQFVERYLPPEGRIDLSRNENTGRYESPQIRINDRGFTFRLGGGTIYSEGFMPEIDVKLIYWKRYALLAGANPLFAGVGASRHVDDFTPFTNLELFILGGPSWEGSIRFGAGIRTNF